MGDSTTVSNINGYVNNIGLWIGLYSIVISIIGAAKLSQWYMQLYRTKYLRKIWGFKDKDTVIVICSELDEAHARQNLDPREFYYHFKYGDIDGYFEVVVTLLRLYPKLKLKVISSGEAINIRVDLSQHLVLVGGPDFNHVTKLILSKNKTQFDYYSPDLPNKSKLFPNEISLFHKPTEKEFCHNSAVADYGYFEKIKNPLNPNKQVILLGGCHSMGVTSSVKAFSLPNNEHDEIPPIVMENSKKVSSLLSSKMKEFCILVEAERIGQSISTPQINKNEIWVKINNVESTNR